MNEEVILKLADYGTSALALFTAILLIRFVEKNKKNGKQEEMLYIKFSNELMRAVGELKEVISELKSCIEAQKTTQDLILKEIFYLRELNEKRKWDREIST